MRTFVAIATPPSGPVPEFLDECRRRLDQRRPDVKWVSAQHRHITLRFLGDLSLNDLPRVKDAVRAAAACRPAFDAHLMDWGAFPNPMRPQTLWTAAEADGDAFGELAAALLVGLRAVGIAPETKRFHPHVTLGRVRSPRGTDALADALRTPAPLADGARFPVERITLFESVLSPAGPRYTVLMEAPLDADGQSL